jgi:uncharacterized membrane protein YccC
MGPVVGRKAVSGKVLTLIIALIIAIVALILLWTFLQDAVPFLTNAVEAAIDGLKNMLCDKLGIAGWILGC